jgi:hypothetical protein
MWPAEPDAVGGRPLAARWPRAAALALACTAVAYALLLAAPQWMLAEWAAAPRRVREVVAALWFVGAFGAVVAALVWLQRPGRGSRPGGDEGA